MSVVAIEQVTLFIVDTYRSMYVATTIHDAQADRIDYLCHTGTSAWPNLLSVEAWHLQLMQQSTINIDLARRCQLMPQALLREFSTFINSTFATVRTDVQSAISGVDSTLVSAVATINKLPGVNINAPTVSVPSLESLNNISVPSDFMNGLVSLNNTLPTLDDLKAQLDDIISIPFEDLRSGISAMRNITINQTLLPVPQRQTLSFCQVHKLPMTCRPD